MIWSRTRKRAFASLFGEEFARAYEEQLERLKAEGAGPTIRGRASGNPKRSRVRRLNSL